MAIEYIRKDIPSFTPPQLTGERYEVMTPDTFDVAERAALAVRCMTDVTDPKADHEVYWLVELWHDPPVMQRDWSSGIAGMSFHESVPLLRLISGSMLRTEVDQRWLEVLLHMQGQTGLLYHTKIGRPWHHFEYYGGESPGDHYIVPNGNGRALAAMSLAYRRSGDELWRRAGQGVVDALLELAQDDGKYMFFPAMEYGQDGSYRQTSGKLTLDENGHYKSEDGGIQTGGIEWWSGFILRGACRFYEATGYQPAKKLADKLAHWYMRVSDYFGPAGEFSVDAGVPGPKFSVDRDYPHFYSHVEVLKCLFEYSQVSDDPAVLPFVKRAFEYAKQWVDPFLGYVGETIGTPFAETCESDGQPGMIFLALSLSAAGAGDYWDDADRWIRNQFAESQMTHCDWVYRLADRHGIFPAWARPRWYDMKEEIFYTADRVAERNVGAILSFRTPNDLMDVEWRPGCHGIMHDTSYHCLYDIWKHILDYRDGQLRVNLLMNRASPWADVDSYIPYEGRVDVNVKQACQLQVRIPQWVEPEQVQCQVNDQPRPITFDSRYAQVGSVNPNDTVALTCPIAERSEQVWIQKRRYQLVIKGNDVVVIDPPGRNYPCYQRAHYRQNTVRWKKTTRFIADPDVNW